jgi:hypothetical protein
MMRWVSGAAGVLSLEAYKSQPSGGHETVETCKESRFFAGTTLALKKAMTPTPRLILLVFLLLQVFDGVLTYVAVAMLGVVSEGNLLLATAMHFAGAGPALFGAKALAAGCGILLYFRGFHGILGILTGLYLVGAITPWLMVFHNL